MRIKVILPLVLMVVIAVVVFYQIKQPNQAVLVFWNSSVESNTQNIDHSAWQEVLENYVETDHSSGVYLFDYGNLDEDDIALLDGYIQQLSMLDPRQYSRLEQKAYWINLYNALTVKLITQNYPVESITKLGTTLAAFGPWDDSAITIVDQSLSLNDIEHGILRPLWQDPRIHFAVNCASIGCPNLQVEAFTANNMESLLDAAAKQYIAHPRGVRFVEGKLVLSSIFDWYGQDFGVDTPTILQALSKYASDKTAQQLKNYQGPIDYEYDWRLNDAEASFL